MNITMLGITRTQLPLRPAFAMTAHAPQGQTLKQGAIVDLRIGSGPSPIASYVAMTRVERRDGLLIYRPFERALFQRGPREGPELLLRVLRHDEVNWKEIDEKHTPQGYCVEFGMWSCAVEEELPAAPMGKEERSETLQAVRGGEETSWHAVGMCAMRIVEA